MMGTFSIWHWVIVLVVVVLIFGTKKLANIGGDLGKAVKGFKEGVKSDETKEKTEELEKVATGETIDVEAKEKVKE